MYGLQALTGLVVSALVLAAPIGCASRVAEPVTSDAVGDVASDLGPEVVAMDCPAAATRFANALWSRLPEGGVLVLRVRADTLSIAHFHAEPRAGKTIDEATARETVAKTLYEGAPFPGSASYESLADPASGFFVFYAPPLDFGGLGIVGTDSALHFAARVVWGGSVATDLKVPTAWETTPDLAGACPPRTLGYTAAPHPRGTSTALHDAAMLELAKTPIAHFPGALGKALIVLFPRHAGMVGPDRKPDEWIVAAPFPSKT